MEKKKSNSKNTKSSSTKKTAAKSSVKKSTTSAKKTSAAVKTSKKVSATKSTADLKKIREEEKPKVDLIKVEKKNYEKSIKNFEFMKFVLYGIGILLIALGVLFNNNLLETEVFGLILGDCVIPVKLVGFLFIGVTGVIQSIRSEKHSLLKSVIVVLLLAVLGAWIFPNGYLSGTSYVDSGAYGLTFNDFVSLAYNGIYMCIDKILMVIFIALFYKIAEATGAYHKVVDSIAKKLKGKEKNVALAIAVIVIALISFITEIYAVLFFLPFFVSILSKLKVDKFTTFAVTFGALIVGAIGSPYGTEALSGFNYYASLSIENAFMYRVILQLCVVVLFALFVSLRMKETSKEEAVEEQFLTELEYKKINANPLIALLIITALFMTVGFIDWSGNFEITMFEEFHEWLFALSIGEFMPFVLLLGDSSYASVIGLFTVFDAITVLFVISLLMIVAYKINFDKLIEIFISTMKFLAKPLMFIIIITAVFTVGYMTQFMASVGQYILSLTTEFNPYSNAFVAALSGVFHNDLAFTGYVFSAFFSSEYTAVGDALSITYTSISALIQLIIPTSPLLIGLYYTKVPYKSWIKYIALFFAGILIVILILLTVITYLG